MHGDAGAAHAEEAGSLLQLGAQRTVLHPGRVPAIILTRRRQQVHHHDEPDDDDNIMVVKMSMLDDCERDAHQHADAHDDVSC